MADPFGDPNDPGASKRPAPTIEGTATEIASEPAAGAAESEASEATDGTDNDDGFGERAEPAPEPPPPPRTSADDLKGFFTHLAAGLLGGLIGVIALAFAWKLLPLGSGENVGDRRAASAGRQAPIGPGARRRRQGHRRARPAGQGFGGSQGSAAA